MAEEDIVCYKYLYKRKDIFISPYKQFIYRYKETYPRIILRIERECSFGTIKGFYIEKGYHSYVDRKTCSLNSIKGYDIVKCIIPKGSIYFSNGVEYVSSNIFIPDKRNVFQKLMDKIKSLF